MRVDDKVSFGNNKIGTFNAKPSGKEMAIGHYQRLEGIKEADGLKYHRALVILLKKVF